MCCFAVKENRRERHVLLGTSQQYDKGTIHSVEERKLTHFLKKKKEFQPLPMKEEEPKKALLL